MPIKVIPICTVDRNLSGSSASFSAAIAPRLPFFASEARRVFLAEINATSDIENTPLRSISPIIIIKSSIRDRQNIYAFSTQNNKLLFTTKVFIATM